MSADSNYSVRFRKRAASFCRAPLLLLGLGALSLYSYGQLVGTRFNIDSNGSVELQYFGSDDAYYILKRGDSLVGVFTIRDMVLGEAQMVEFTEGVTPLQSVYYQLDEVPLTRPLDSDRDGIDDAFELAHPNILDPLDPLDSVLDSDNDGISNFEEYVRGTDIASVSNIAPKVNLTLPASGSGFVSPATIQIRATASDPDGSVTRVDFYQGNQKIGEDSTVPFEFSWSNVLEGDYVLTAVAVDGDGSSATTLGTLVGVVDGSSAPLTVINTTSPLIGAQGVAVTRETIITLSNPLNDSAVVDSSVVTMSEGSEELQARIEVSKDRRKIRVFYNDKLPSNTRINGVFDGSLVTDLLGRQIDADGDGDAGGIYEFFFDTLNTVSLANTSVCGRVFASELAQGNDAGSVNVPLAGVRVSVDGQSDEIFAFTDQFGDFRLENVPAGRFFVHIDGREVTRLEDNIRYPDLAYYPNVGKPWVSIPNEEVNIGEVYLPLINGAALQQVSADEATVIGFPLDVIRNNPELKDLQIEVPANSLFRDDGTRGGMVGIAPVPPDRLPGQLPEGLDFPVVITVQTDGATNFDVPVPICAPNLDGLAPGEKTALWSFNHDTGQFEIVGPATVSADGKTVCTDPGVGITAPGWHGFLDRIFVFLGRMFGFPPGTRPPPQGENQDCAKNDCPCPGKCGTKNEVLLHSGEEYYVQDDLVIPGRAGMDFVMRRTYRSQLTYDGPLGHGWNWEYNEGLWIQENGDAMRVNGRSHIATWKANGDGTFEAPEGYFGVLMQDTDGSYVLITPDGFERYYREDGRLFCHQDQFGNRMLFDYDHFGNLSKVIDVYGREIDFTFTLQSDGNRRLTKVTDFIGREVVYEYDNNGDLVSCRSPIVEGTSTGNDFPNGRVERYTYSSGFADEELNHNLLSVTRPQEVADGGPEALSWTYGTDPNDPLTFDKVIAESNGGTNSSGVEAGGTMTFVYEMLNENEPLDQPDIPRGKAIITSRNGNVSEYFINEKNLHIITREITKGLRPGEPAFFETRNFFNDDGLVVRTVFPEGNELQYVYDESGDRRSQSNLLEERSIAGPRGGGDDLVTTYTYEPLFNKLLTITDPRGNAPDFVPAIGDWDPERYTTRYFYDYQESDTPVRLAENFGFDLSSITRGLGDLNDDDRTDQQFGNVVRIEGTPVELLPSSSEAVRIGGAMQPNVVEMQWNDNGQLLAVIDQEGNVTEHEYYPANDPDGDGLLTKTRYVFLDAKPTGYLKTEIQDSRDSSRRTSSIPPVALRTRLRYDEVGNVVSSRNPRGVVTLTEYNQLNEPVAMTSGADISRALSSNQLISENSPFRYRVEYIYDHNGRLVEQREENRDDATPGVGAFVDMSFEYDILDNVVMETTEVDSETSLITQYRYDENELMTRVIKPLGNEVHSEYDERDLVIRKTVAPNSDGPTVFHFDYDGNRNLVRIEDSEDTDGDGSEDANLYVYDGFDRRTSSTDAVGNVTQFVFDPASNTIEERIFGHPANNSNAANVLLYEGLYRVDERDRVFQLDESLFLSDGFTPSRSVLLSDENGDSLVTTLWEYDALDRQTRIVDDAGDSSSYVYDGVSRIVTTNDEMGNQRIFNYDRNHNVVRALSVEKGPSGIEEDAFETIFVYDQLDRLVRVTDNVGETMRFAYDSRNNRILRSDTNGPIINDPLGLYNGQINGHGNTTRYLYDGADRLVSRVHELRTDGAGGNPIDTSNPDNPDGLVTVMDLYDDNSRLVSRIDDKGQETNYAYDSHDRLVSVTFDDGTQTLIEYDADSNVTRIEDANGSVVTREYDALNRLVQANIVPGLGVVGPTQETYAYDGFSRMTRHSDNGGPGGAQNTVEMVYDSLGRLVEERQNDRVVSYTHTGDSKLTQQIYPGGEVFDLQHDALDRAIQISSGGSAIFETAFIGPSVRETAREFGNGTRLSFLDQAGESLIGYDGERRVASLKHLAPGGAAFVDRRYEYDRMGNRISERRVLDSSLTDQYSFDSLYRLTQAGYDQNGNPGAVPRSLTNIEYQLDGVGNWTNLDKTVNGEQSSQAFQVNSINEYTQVGSDSYSYDLNGNLVGGGGRTFVYDYRNRLVEARDASSNNLIARYSYFADGRRATKEKFNPADQSLVQSIDFHYAGVECIEEFDRTTDRSLVTYIGNPAMVDEVVRVNRTASNPLGAGELYLHSNARQDVVAVTDENGAVVEQFRYDAYGSAEETSQEGVPYRFLGMRLDEETGLYYVRNRYYDPALGRFLQRDPVYDPMNVGNQYAFVGNNPVSRSDPMGLNTRTRAKNVPLEYAKKFYDWMKKIKGIKGAIDSVKKAKMMRDMSRDLAALERLRSSGQLSRRGKDLATRIAANRGALRNGFMKNAPGALDVVTGVVDEGLTSMNTSWYGAAGRTGGVTASNAALNYTPQGQIVSNLSSIVDNVADLGETYELWNIGGAPKAGEVFNNAGRAVGVVNDFISDAISPETDCHGRPRPNRGWRSMQNLVNHMKNKQGSLSKKLVETGEWWGEPLGDLWNWASGESARSADLDRQARELQARRRARGLR